MGTWHVYLSLLCTYIALYFSDGLQITGNEYRSEAASYSVKSLTQLALAVARATYLPIDGNRFIRNGSIMENPARFGKGWLKCPKNKSEMDLGLCYKPCKQPASWAFVKGVGPVCWGCPKSHPVEQGALCYRKCPKDRPRGRMFWCFGDCPSGYRNDGLTCFRDVHIHSANNGRCPWYDVCGLTFSRGCSKCPAGYKNDGCTCRRDAHVVARPRYNRGIGVLMKSYGRGIGQLPTLFRYDPSAEREACKSKDWDGKAYVKKGTEVIRFRNDRQKIVAFGFRGTEESSIKDWLANLDLHPVDFLVNSTRVTSHRGFKNRYDDIADWFEKEYRSIPSDYTILLTGHSLGGSEATIAAVFAAGKLGRSPDAVITWGAPSTGAKNFKEFYQKVIGCNVTLRYVTKGDTIAHLAGLYGYEHVCNRVKLEPRVKGFFSFFRAHSLYMGYGVGLKRKYRDSKEIKLGCDVPMETVLMETIQETENVVGI